MKNLIFAAIATLIAHSSFSSDILTMLDGKMYQVDVIRVKSCELTVKIENEKFVIPATEIQSIEFENVNDPEYLDNRMLKIFTVKKVDISPWEFFSGLSQSWVQLYLLTQILRKELKQLQCQPINRCFLIPLIYNATRRRRNQV
jgi:hypothetical protein